MPVFDQLDAWIADTDTTIAQVRRRQKAQLYAKGVKSKLQQADYSLKQIQRLSGKIDAATVTTGDDEPPIHDQINFYCDIFFAFLYSSVDILAQVINQGLQLELEEHQVDFWKVSEKLEKQPHSGSAIQMAATACRDSTTYTNIKKYRNCSSHRRRICIGETHGILTDGYVSTTGPFGGVERFLCDNPLDVTPKFDQGRLIPDYIEDSQRILHSHVEKVFKQLNPI